MTTKDTICKINCCFSDTIYKKFQNKKYGINYCLNPGEASIEYLSELKELFDYYQIPDDGQSVHICNENKLIELINIL